MRKITLSKIYWDKNDVKAVSDIIKSGRGWAIGPKIEEFEKKLAKYVGTKYAIAFNSGTSALHSLLLAYGIKEGDEVIVPSFTFIATSNACLMVGATPVFAEIEKETCGLNPSDVEKKITQKTKAIIPVHYGGLPCKIKEIKKISDKYNLILIEDAAESLGAKIKLQKIGTFGHAAVLSFCGPKVITTGEGGAAITDSKEIYEKLKLIRSHGRAETDNYFISSEYMDYVQLGYNFRMSTMTAALGISQLAKIDKIIGMRRQNAEYLSGKLKNVDEIKLIHAPKGYFHVYQMFAIFVNGGSKLRDALKNHLNKKGIGARVYFHPNHLTSFYRRQFGCGEGFLKETEAISDKVLVIQMYPDLKKEEMNFMAKEIKLFFSKQ